MVVSRSSSLFICLILFVNCLKLLKASTHWIVTEDGRIQAQMDSVFQLRRPYDLVALLQQEERSSLIDTLKKDLITQKNDIDRNEDKEVNVEQKLYTEDADCMVAEKALTEFDLYISTIILFENKGVNVEEFFDDDPAFPPFRQPDCTKIINLEFSMHTFEHLQALQQRSNLTILPEKELLFAVSNFENVHEFGHHVNENLSKNNTSWLFFNLAVYYWRIVGNAYNALECVRRAIHFSPSDFRDIALMSLTNILHRAQHSDEALMVARIINSDYPPTAQNYFLLGNIYTILTDYNKSVSCYNMAIKMQPEFEIAIKYKHAVLCHTKLEQALEEQHNSLQQTLSDLRDYQTHHEVWLQQQEKLRAEQASLESRIESRLEYEGQRIQRSLDGTEKDCFQHQSNGRTYVTCNVHHEAYITVDSKKIDLNLNLKLLQSVESQTENLEETMSKQKDTKSQNDFREEITSNYSDPTKPVKYSKKKFTDAYNSGVFEFLKSNWPSANDCATIVSSFPSTEEYPSIFLPPENKGFEVEKMLSELQGLDADNEHSLPWYPPICGKLERMVSPYDTMSFMQKLDKASKRADLSLRKILFSYRQSNEATEEEIGQRILTALNKSLGPPWLLYNLAALYWRINGNLQNVIDCLRFSIHSAPTEYLDVPLINLASVLHKQGFINDAFSVASTAVHLHEFEPETNYLMANLLAMKKNYTGAFFYYKRTALQNSSFEDVMKHMLQVACRDKYQLHVNSETTEAPPFKTMCPPVELDSITCQSQQSSCQNEIEVGAIRCFSHPAQVKILNEMQECKNMLALEMLNRHQSLEQQKSQHLLKLLSEENILLPGKLSSHNLEIEEEINVNDREADLVEDEDYLNFNLVSDFSGASSRENQDPVMDDPLPDVIPTFKNIYSLPIPTLKECKSLRFINLRQFTSTLLSVSAKEINVNDHVDFSIPVTEGEEELPHCDSHIPSSANMLDHLAGMKHRQKLLYKAEDGLIEAFQTLGQEDKQPMPVIQVASSIALAMQKNLTSWVLPTLAALYWRIMGNAEEAIICLRQALHYAPHQMKDIPLISLANIFHRSKLFNDALIVANMALEISPKLVVIHFTLANIFAAKGDLEKAANFYESTLALQPFQPAKDRLHSIQCRTFVSNLRKMKEQENI